ncbi:MAG: hypothetical protein IH957_12925 [Chloroflexi bacterium]|nr:hypothetical protein [Chloroflexota bacterium]
MKYLLAPTTVIGGVAPLFSSVAPATACICLPTATTTEERIASSKLVVVGDVVSRTDSGAIVSVELYLKGSGPTYIEVHDPPGGECGVFRQLGDRFVLFLNTDEGSDEPPRTSSCFGNIRLGGQSPGGPHVDRLLAITGPGQPPDDAAENDPQPIDRDVKDDDLPHEVFWPLALVLPIALLTAATLSPWRRRK